MIIVDEFHHSASLLSHFKPKILLGLTATPERMDGKSILTYFDNRMAAEIRLSDAIEGNGGADKRAYAIMNAVERIAPICVM